MPKGCCPIWLGGHLVVEWLGRATRESRDGAVAEGDGRLLVGVRPMSRQAWQVLMLQRFVPGMPLETGGVASPEGSLVWMLLMPFCDGVVIIRSEGGFQRTKPDRTTNVSQKAIRRWQRSAPGHVSLGSDPNRWYCHYCTSIFPISHMHGWKSQNRIPGTSIPGHPSTSSGLR